MKINFIVPCNIGIPFFDMHIPNKPFDVEKILIPIKEKMLNHYLVISDGMYGFIGNPVKDIEHCLFGYRPLNLPTNVHWHDNVLYSMHYASNHNEEFFVLGCPYTLKFFTERDSIYLADKVYIPYLNSGQPIEDYYLPPLDKEVWIENQEKGVDCLTFWNKKLMEK